VRSRRPRSVASARRVLCTDEEREAVSRAAAYLTELGLPPAAASDAGLRLVRDARDALARDGEEVGVDAVVGRAIDATWRWLDDVAVACRVAAARGGPPQAPPSRGLVAARVRSVLAEHPELLPWVSDSRGERGDGPPPLLVAALGDLPPGLVPPAEPLPMPTRSFEHAPQQHGRRGLHAVLRRTRGLLGTLRRNLTGS
jgi:hypothetical protein